MAILLCQSNIERLMQTVSLHIVNTIKIEVQHVCCEVLEHPATSLDLSFDFHSFGQLKQALKECQFQ
jgi:hypothetical protein